MKVLIMLNEIIPEGEGEGVRVIKIEVFTGICLNKNERLRKESNFYLPITDQLFYR